MLFHLLGYYQNFLNWPTNYDWNTTTFFLISFFPYAGTIIIIIINDDQGWRDGRVAGKDVVGRSSIQIIVLLVLSQNM